MRALRTSAFMSPNHEPLTTVLVEPSLKGTIEEAVVHLRTPGTLVIHDIFDVPNPPIGAWEATPEDAGAATVLATTEAMRRIDEAAERNMAVMFFYNAAALRVATAGVFPTAPAPLTVEQIRTVFEQLATHPAYDGQHVHAFTERGHRIDLKNGHVTDLPPE
jgi:hypothetical protein